MTRHLKPTTCDLQPATSSTLDPSNLRPSDLTRPSATIPPQLLHHHHRTLHQPFLSTPSPPALPPKLSFAHIHTYIHNPPFRPPLSHIPFRPPSLSSCRLEYAQSGRNAYTATHPHRSTLVHFVSGTDKITSNTHFAETPDLWPPSPTYVCTGSRCITSPANLPAEAAALRYKE
jgi:hypothetical protein